MTSGVEAFIIHLRSADQRKRQVELLAGQLPVPTHIVDAVPGAELSADEIAAVYRRFLHTPHYPFPLRRQEIGCFLSHRNAWRLIVERRLTAGLILEDDVALDLPLFTANLDLALKHMARHDFIRFPIRQRGHSGRLIEASAGSRLMVQDHPGLGMVAQLVAHDAARALLALTEQFDRPVDTTIQMRWLHGVRVVTVLPVAVREISDELGGSTVQRNERRPLTQTISRTALRARYRLLARLHNLMRKALPLPPGSGHSRKIFDGRKP